jgi:hypothetical protein
MRNTSYASGIQGHIKQKEEDVYDRQAEKRAELTLRLRRRLQNFGPEHLFTIMDTDESGQVDKRELRAGLESLGMHLLRDDFDTVFNELDLDGSGGIEIHELSRFLDSAWSADQVTPKHDSAGQYQLELEEQLQLKKMKKAAKEQRLLAESRAYTAALKQQARTDGVTDKSTKRVGKYLLQQQIKEERRQLERQQEIKDLSPAVFAAPVFVGVPKSVVRTFIEKSTKHRIRPGNPLFKSGDAADICFFIVKGVMELSTDDGTSYTLEAGAVFGQEAIFVEKKAARSNRSSPRSPRNVDLGLPSIATSDAAADHKASDLGAPGGPVHELRTLSATVPADAGTGCICFGLNKKLVEHLVGSSEQFKARFANLRRAFLAEKAVPPVLQAAVPSAADITSHSPPSTPSTPSIRKTRRESAVWGTVDGF